MRTFEFPHCEMSFLLVEVSLFRPNWLDLVSFFEGKVTVSRSHPFSNKDEKSAVFRYPDSFPIYCSVTSGLIPFTVEKIPQFLADTLESLYKMVLF